MIAASPSLFHAWRTRASSAHPREAESDSSLARVAKTEACGGAHATMHAVALIYKNVVVSQGLREMLHYSDREKALTLRI